MKGLKYEIFDEERNIVNCRYYFWCYIENDNIDMDEYGKYFNYCWYGILL